MYTYIYISYTVILYHFMSYIYIQFIFHKVNQPNMCTSTNTDISGKNQLQRLSLRPRPWS